MCCATLRAMTADQAHTASALSNCEHAVPIAQGCPARPGHEATCRPAAQPSTTMAPGTNLTGALPVLFCSVSVSFSSDPSWGTSLGTACAESPFTCTSSITAPAPAPRGASVSSAGLGLRSHCWPSSSRLPASSSAEHLQLSSEGWHDELADINLPGCLSEVCFVPPPGQASFACALA